MMDIFEAIKTRRSIRKYQDAPVADDVLQKVLEAARWAPSWANTQCCHFVIVRDEKVRAGLVESLAVGNPATEAIKTAPVIVVACAELGKAGCYHGEPCTEKGDWFMFDVALAMQNLVLAAHALGLGTVFTGNFDGGEAANVLGVPAGYVAVAMTPLGYPDQDGRVTPRKELAEIVHYDKFGVTEG